MDCAVRLGSYTRREPERESARAAAPFKRLSAYGHGIAPPRTVHSCQLGRRGDGTFFTAALVSYPYPFHLRLIELYTDHLERVQAKHAVLFAAAHPPKDPTVSFRSPGLNGHAGRRVAFKARGGGITPTLVRFGPGVCRAQLSSEELLLLSGCAAGIPTQTLTNIGQLLTKCWRNSGHLLPSLGKLGPIWATPCPKLGYFGRIRRPAHRHHAKHTCPREHLSIICPCFFPAAHPVGSNLVSIVRACVLHARLARQHFFSRGFWLHASRRQLLGNSRGLVPPAPTHCHLGWHPPMCLRCASRLGIIWLHARATPLLGQP